MSEPTNREVVVLNAALELRPAERAAYLDEACAGDAALRQQVEDLLRADAAAEGFLEAPPAGLGVGRTVRLSVPPTEKPGDKIGHYKLLQQIGEGGCGVVYMAEQEEPVRRRVALKVIKLGMDTKQVIARFDAERQALALMDHPNIAKVLEAGATETGRPYFVMELVRGIKITDFCDEHKLSTTERLKLFIQVCQAIQHAHQKGIIHRDIKPSNILVTINDGVPVPKVIDFGIAKATQGRLTDQTLFTAFEQFIGTPAYMSPEQAVMTSLDIDTRSDIYSLGVLLYELLTGCTPFDANELLQSGLDAMRRTIREKEPPRPSTRLSTMAADALMTTAKHCHTDAPKLLHAVRGDLDWIVMKCLEKDRARRYETANGVAMDITRHLNCEPVVARPPSRLYEFQKTVRRHKFGFAAGTAVITVLAVGVLVSTWQAIRATRAERDQSRLRQQAVEARNIEAELRLKAQADEMKARTEAAWGAQVNQFVSDLLSDVGTGVTSNHNRELVHQLLGAVAKRVEKDLAGQPEVEADLRERLGLAYRGLDEYTNAEVMFQGALRLRKQVHGEDDPSVAALRQNLISLLEKQGKLAEAEAIYREALAVQRKLLGNEHPALAPLLYNLANAVYEQGRLSEAEGWFREVLAIRRKHLVNELPDTAAMMSSLATVLRRQGKFAEAEPLYRECLAAREKKVPDAWYTFYTRTMLGDALLGQKKLSEAEPLLISGYEGMKQREDKIRDRNKVFPEALQCLVRLYEATGQTDQAAEWRKKLAELDKAGK